jgi:hypothetical protein
MSNWEKASDWVRMLVGYTIWFVILIVGRQVVLSLHGVENIGFAAYPTIWRGAYPAGLLWSQLFDVLFRVIIIISVLSIGGRIREVVSSAFPRLPRLERLVPLALGVAALIIGFFALKPIVVPPLTSQGVEWAYALIFWVAMGGMLAITAFEVGHMLSTSGRAPQGESGASGFRAPAIDQPAPAPPSESPSRSSLAQHPQDAYVAPNSEGKVPCDSVGAVPPAACTPPAPIAPSQKSPPAPQDIDRSDRVLRFTRSAPAGSTAKALLAWFLQIEAEHEPYKALLVSFVTPPPDVKRTRLLAIPASRPLEPTALEILSKEESDSWGRMTVGGIVILAEHSEQQWDAGSGVS